MRYLGIIGFILLFMQIANAEISCDLIKVGEAERVRIYHSEYPNVPMTLELIPTTPTASFAQDFGDFKLVILRGAIHVFENKKEVCLLRPASYRPY